MNYQDILYEEIGNIARISHNRPSASNAEGRRLLEELDHAMAYADADPNINVVILASVGKNFSAGHDMRESARDRSDLNVEERWTYEFERYLGYCMRIRELSKPTIAQVQGACIAAGFMVANMCDLMVASDDAYFSDPTCQTLGSASVEVLVHPWVLGMRKAKEMLFTGERFTAIEGLQYGMINRVVPRSELEEETLTLARRIASAPPFGLKLIKRSLNRTMDAQGFRTAVAAHFDTHELSHFSTEFKAISRERKAAAAEGKTSFGRTIESKRQTD